MYAFLLRRPLCNLPVFRLRKLGLVSCTFTLSTRLSCMAISKQYVPFWTTHDTTSPFIHSSQANILVNDKLEASISDFGLARIPMQSGFTTKAAGGTYRWLAHELVFPDDDDSDEEPVLQATTATDVWAFAMTILEVCFVQPSLASDCLLTHCASGRF